MVSSFVLIVDLSIAGVSLQSRGPDPDGRRRSEGINRRGRAFAMDDQQDERALAAELVPT
jgi:hypothetical protein